MDLLEKYNVSGNLFQKPHSRTWASVCSDPSFLELGEGWGGWGLCLQAIVAWPQATECNYKHKKSEEKRKGWQSCGKPALQRQRGKPLGITMNVLPLSCSVWGKNWPIETTVQDGGGFTGIQGGPLRCRAQVWRCLYQDEAWQNTIPFQFRHIFLNVYAPKTNLQGLPSFIIPTYIPYFALEISAGKWEEQVCFHWWKWLGLTLLWM